MGHPCHRCGSNVEDGTRFCQQCGAAQIRVSIAPIEPDAEIVNPDFAMPAPKATSAATISAVTRNIYDRNKWKSVLPPAVLLGLTSPVILWALKFGFFLVALSAGFLAVVIFRTRTKLPQVERGDALRLGALTGLLSFIITGVWFAVDIFVLSRTGEMQKQLAKALADAAKGNPDPQVQAMVRDLSTPHGLMLLIAFTCIVLFVGTLVACTAGGGLASFLKGPPEESRDGDRAL